MKKKYIKYATIGIFSAAAIGIIVGFSTSWKKMPTISIAGSSAVFPLIEEYSNTYNKSDIVAQAGGSGVGINSALNNTKNIGMASKNPKGLEPNLIDQWTNKKMKTVTIAWDGIGIVYKSSSSEQLDITDNNISKIYKCFAGYENISFSDLISGSKNTSTIKAFSRDGGSEKSGTADAFFKDSHLNVEGLTSNETLALTNGIYGKNVVQTAEANSQSWDAIKNSNEKNSMIYLSTGFILNNKNDIEKNGFKIATYNGVELTSNTITQGYNWYRPLNLIVSLVNIPSYVVDFISWTIDISNIEIQNILSELGYVILNQKDIDSMALNNKEWWESPDYELGYCGANVEPNNVYRK